MKAVKKTSFDIADEYLAPVATPVEAPAQAKGLTEGQVKAVRGQRTEWHDLKINDFTTGVLICSTVLDADIWLALRDDFEPDPELPNLAIFYAHEIPILKDKTAAQLKKIHEVKLTFGPGSKVRQ
jgi:hypothetical protein